MIPDKQLSLNIYLVEDMAITRLSLIRVLESNGYRVVGSSAKAQTALVQISSLPVDLVLIDINLVGDKDGIWLAKYIRKTMNLPLVFLTAFGDNVTLEKLNHIEPDGYVKKPFDKPTLITTVKIAHTNFHKNQQESKQPEVEPQPKFIFVKHGAKKVKVLISDIYYVEADKNYVNIYLESKNYSIRATLKQTLSLLNQKGFIKINKGCAVNIDYVQIIAKEDVKLQNGISLHLSRIHVTTISDALKTQ